MILVYGTVCLDRLRKVPQWPKLGGYVEMESDEAFLGGEAANTASHLARWGAEFRLIGNRLGEGEGETILRTQLKKYGIDDTHLQSGARTPICDIYVTPDGERTMIGRGFSTMATAHQPEEIEIPSGAWFSAEPNLGKIARDVVRYAAAQGAKLYLMDFFQDDDPVEPGSYWQSSTDWVGRRNNVPHNIEWVQKWVDRHGCFAILTDGPHGYAAGGPGLAAKWYHAPIAPRIVDATGAGDAFRAGMLYSLSQDWPFEKCLRYASAAGSLKCGWLGGPSAQNTVEQTMALAGL